MGIPKLYKDMTALTVRIDTQLYNMLTDISEQKSHELTSRVTVQDLVRRALMYVYYDNMAMRECFRHTRGSVTARTFYN